MMLGLFSSVAGFGESSPIDAYIAASMNRDPAVLAHVVGTAAYYDGDMNREVPAADIAAYLRPFVGPSLKLVSKKDAGETTELSWSLGSGRIDFTDTLTFSGGQLSRVVTKGVPASPAEAAWVDKFVVARQNGTGPVFRPFFVASARIFGRSFPQEGATVDEYMEFLDLYSATVYVKLPDSPIVRAKDGHYYYRFEVRNPSGSVLAGGTDHLYRQGDLVSKLVGVY